MDGAGQQLLAGAGLAQDEDGDVAVDDAADLVHQRADLRIARDQAGQTGPLGRCGGRAGRWLAHRRCHPRRLLGGHDIADGRRRLHAMPHRPVEAGVHMELPPVRQLDRLRLRQRRTEAVHQCRHAGAEQRGQRVHAQRSAAQAELLQRATVGAHQLAVLADGEDALHQRADEFDAAVEMQAHHVAVVVGEPVVLDHPRAHLHQPHRVLVVGALVAGHIQHAEDVAARIQDRRGRARQEMVGVHVVLVRVDERGRLLDQRRADRVRALGLLGPVDAGLQRDLRGTGQEVVVADRMDDRAGGIAQHDHRVAVDDLLVEHLHDRRGMGVEALVALAGHDQVRSPERREVETLDARQAEGGAAFVRVVDLRDMGVVQRQRRRDRPACIALRRTQAQPCRCGCVGSCHGLVSCLVCQSSAAVPPHCRPTVTVIYLHTLPVTLSQHRKNPGGCRAI